MNKKSATIFLSLTLLLIICNPASASTSPTVSLTKQDRILILAPHPDDEAIGTGGIIQKSVVLGIPIKILYLTNGDNNEPAFFMYKKHPVLSRRGLLEMGETRRQEAVNAMESLGVNKNQLTFLGYPDFGTTAIFTKYWGDSRPFKSMLTRVTAVPYKDAFSYKKSHKGENILTDIKTILLNFQPTKIFVTLPADTNGDHRAYYLFMQIALWDLKGKIPEPEIFPYVVHVPGWPLPRGYHPELPLNIPEKLQDSNLTWLTIKLNPVEIEKKNKAIDFYKSQNAYNHKYLYTFARKNELFGRFNDILLKENNNTEINWDKHISEQKIISHLADENKRNKNIIQSATYAQRNGKLIIRFEVNNWVSELDGINLFLMGYKEGTDFSTMPKIRVNITFDRFVSVYDGLKRVAIKDMSFSHKDDILLIEFPISALGDPDRILSSTKTYVADWPLETTPWRTLIVDRNKNIP